MDHKLQEIITKSSFRFEPGEYVYCTVAIPPTGRYFLVAQDQNEITVVTTEDRLSELDVLERNPSNYVLIGLKVSVPFYAVGFLAAVTNEIARGGMNVLVVSTYSMDYLLVRTEHRDKAREALLRLRFQEADK